MTFVYRLRLAYFAATLPREPRAPLQFRLFDLLVFTTVVAIILGIVKIWPHIQSLLAQWEIIWVSFSPLMVLPLLLLLTALLRHYKIIASIAILILLLVVTLLWSRHLVGSPLRADLFSFVLGTFLWMDTFAVAWVLAGAIAIRRCGYRLVGGKRTPVGKSA